MAYINGKEILFSSKINGSGSAQETEEKTVALDMASGSQAVIPSANKVLSKVIITKPSTMLPENIKEGINIGGVIGTLTAGSGGGGGENAPTLFTPTIALANGNTELAITDGNGDFATYEVYIDGVKSGEFTTKNITITDITASTETIQIFVKAIASLFNASENSNVILRVSGDGTAGLIYSGNSCTGYGTATETDIIIASIAGGTDITVIASSAFDNNSTVTSVYIPLSVSKIEAKAFRNCINITDVQGCENVTYIGDQAFKGCTKLENINICDDVTYLGSYCFQDTSLKTVNIPKNITEIKMYTFWKSGLTNVSIPKNITKISSDAFRDCANLALVDLTDYGADAAFPTITAAGLNGHSSTFEIRVHTGRKATLAAMTNWSEYAENIVEV
jgi:hypothetical protein